VLAPLLPESLLHLVAFAVGFGFITFLHVVFGELAPKTIAIAQAERIALFVAPPMKFFYYVFYPGLVVFNGTANFFTRLIGIPPASETEGDPLRGGDSHGTDPLWYQGPRRQGGSGHDRAGLRPRRHLGPGGHGPRPDVVSAPADATLADLRALVVEEGHTRYPVVDAEDGDQVVGFVDVKDLIRMEESSDGELTATAADLQPGPAGYPETGRADDLLGQFRTSRVRWPPSSTSGAPSRGIVTVEDLVEVVVGDIRDQFDVDAREPSIDGNGDGTYAVDGGVSVSDVNNELETAFETDEFGTIGGLVLDRLGRAPKVGDRVTVDGHHLDVDSVEGRASLACLISPDESSADESEDRPEDDSEE